jgi:hypothetical protein
MAVRGLDRAEIARRLDCEDTGKPFRDGGSRKARLALGELENGWIVVLCRRNFDYFTPNRVRVWSASVEALVCQVEEHVMVSLAHAYRNGEQTWLVAHNPAHGFYSLHFDGDVPPALAPIRERLKAEQDAAGGESANVDFFFDVAPKLVAELCGYDDEVDQAIAFTELAPIRKGLLQTIFGKR